MTWKEYIKRNLTRLNPFILSQLMEEDGKSLTNEVWSYLKETPWNTNFRVLEEYTGGTDTAGEVWFTATFIPEAKCNGPNNTRPLFAEPTSVAKVDDLLSDPTAYDIEVDGHKTPYFTDMSTGGVTVYLWANAEQEEADYALAVQASYWNVAVPCELTKDIEVTVTKK